MKLCSYTFWIASAISLSLLNKTCLAQAQPIVTDSTTSTQLGTCGNNCILIEGRTSAGNINLFHSFSRFNVDSQATVLFHNPGVMNILSRVTGAEPSYIQGTLGVREGNANLFLINPNGITFGANAQLNVNGSFVASTASSIRFMDGNQFSANDQVPPTLIVSVPIGLQFGRSAAPIRIEGHREMPIIQVPTGKTLALVGGDVELVGGILRAPGGRIEIGSVANNSFVGLDPITEGWALRYDNVQNFRDINLSQNAQVYAFDNNVGRGGSIHFRGRQINILGGSEVVSFNYETQPGGDITVHASESVEVSGVNTIDKTIFNSSIITSTFSSGAAGSITIDTKSLLVADGGLIQARTDSTGLGGNLTVSAAYVEVFNCANVCSNLSTRTFRNQDDAGRAGTLNITTGSLIVRDGGQLSVSTFGGGEGGQLFITASEVAVRGQDNNNRASALFAESSRSGTIGQGGDITIYTDRLVVEGGGEISVASREGSQGNAGTLQINASKVEVIGTGLDKNGNIVPSTLLGSTTSGEGGNITINVSDYLLLSKGSLISTEAGGSGDGGNITIKGGFVVAAPINSNSDIIANAIDGRAGSIEIQSQGVLGLEVWTQKKLKEEFGSDYLARLPQFKPRERQSNDITAFSQNPANNSGTVDIGTQDVTSTQLVTKLPEEPTDPTQQITQGCGTTGEFIATGRGGLPQSPDDVLTPYTTLEDLGTPVTSTENRINATPSPRPTNAPKQLVEAQGWIYGPDGKVVLTAHANTDTPRGNWQPPANCPVTQTNPNP